MSRLESRSGSVAAAAALLAAVGGLWVGAFREPLLRPVEVISIRAEADPRSEPDSVSGTLVLDSEAGRMPGAGRTVALVARDGTRREVVADAWGRYAFPGVPSGVEHEVRVETPDGLAARAPGILVRPAERRQIAALHLAARTPWRVLVTDEDGAPLAGAVVEVFREAFDEFEAIESWRERVLEVPPVPLAHATTDATGAAALDVSPSCRVTIAVHAPGRARVAEARIWPWRGERWVALPPRCTARGQVVDARGRPVPGALVLARGRPPVIDSHHGTRAASAALWARTAADAEGRFAFDALPPGPVDVRAGRPGTAPLVEESFDVPAVGAVVLEIPDPVRVHGRITETRTGAPAAGIVVRSGQEYDECEATAVTDADGRYSLDWSPVEPWQRAPWVRLAPTAGWRVVAETSRGWHDPMAPGDVATQDFTVARTASLAGRVTGLVPEDAGAWVRWAPVDFGPTFEGRWIGRTFADGSFRIDDFAPDPGRFLASPWIEGLLGPSEIAWLDAAERAPHLVRRAEVPLVAGALVEIEADVVRGVPADKEERSPLRERRIRLSVHVTTRDGLPLRGARADAGDFRLNQLGAWDFPGAAVGPDGRANVSETVYDDDATLRVVAWDARHVVTGVEVPIPDAAESEVAVAIVLEPALTVRGRVEGPDGPVAGAHVTADGRVATTDAGGAFSFRTTDRRPGPIRITADGFVERVVAIPPAPRPAGTVPSPPLDTTPKPGGCDCCRAAAAAQREAEDLGPIADPPEVVCRLERGGTARARVVREDGTPARGIVASLLDDTRDERRRAFTDADGEFSFPLVELRPHAVRLRSPSGDERAIRVLDVLVDPRSPGIPAFVAREGLRIAGRVTAPGGPAPRVHWLRWERLAREGESPGTGPAWEGDVRVDDDGRFRISGLDEGEFLLTVHVGSPPPVTVRARAGGTDVRIDVPAEAGRR